MRLEQGRLVEDNPLILQWGMALADFVRPELPWLVPLLLVAMLLHAPWVAYCFWRRSNGIADAKLAAGEMAIGIAYLGLAVGLAALGSSYLFGAAHALSPNFHGAGPIEAYKSFIRHLILPDH